MSTETSSMNSTPDTRYSLIGRLGASNNVDAWNEFAQIYQPLIFRIARRRGLQYADAAEVTQEVLTRVAKAVDGWDPDRNKGTFRGWLYRITRNVTVDYLRKAGRQPINLNALSGLPIDNLVDPGQEHSREFQYEYEKQLFVWAAKRVQTEFKPNTWQAFWQTAVEGDSIQEAGTELGMTSGAIYVARSRVMKRLSEEVKKRTGDSTV